MKVIDKINNRTETLISFEVLPPLKGKTIQSVFDHLDHSWLTTQHGSMLPITAAKAASNTSQTDDMKR